VFLFLSLSEDFERVLTRLLSLSQEYKLMKKKMAEMKALEELAKKQQQDAAWELSFFFSFLFFEHLFQRVFAWGGGCSRKKKKKRKAMKQNIIVRRRRRRRDAKKESPSRSQTRARTRKSRNVCINTQNVPSENEEETNVLFSQSRELRKQRCKYPKTPSPRQPLLPSINAFFSCAMLFLLFYTS